MLYKGKSLARAGEKGVRNFLLWFSRFCALLCAFVGREEEHVRTVLGDLEPVDGRLPLPGEEEGGGVLVVMRHLEEEDEKK